MYIVVTGLRLRSPLYHPVFLYHAVRSFSQAQRDTGNLHTAQNTIDGVHHTITAWRNADASRAYGHSDAHRRAVAVFAKIATGKVYAGTHDAIPDWHEARRLWDRLGVVV